MWCLAKRCFAIIFPMEDIFQFVRANEKLEQEIVVFSRQSLDHQFAQRVVGLVVCPQLLLEMFREVCREIPLMARPSWKHNNTLRFLLRSEGPPTSLWARIFRCNAKLFTWE
jgi:hypothetical protein